jgi:sn-glycerol 3-phosphate transport system ATP-binding protein
MSEVVLHDIHKSYGTSKVVHGIDLRIPDRSFCVILGPSGCGKSTVLRMIAGLEQITAGTLTIGGATVNDRSPSERNIAMVFQNYALYPHMTVARNMGYALEIQGVKRAERDRRVREAAAILDLADLLDRKPGQLSGGQRQRVAMGRAIVREPQVFLFDEPLSNLDAKLRVQMRAEIRGLHRRLGATSVFVTHDQIEAMTLADTIVVMNAGRIEQIGSPAEIYGHPASLFVAGFIGSPPMNLLKVAGGPDGRSVMFGDRIVPLPASAPPIATGRPVILGVRPEHVRLGAPEDLPIPARFDFVEDTGSTHLLHLEAGGQTIVAAVAAEAAFDPSAPLALQLPPRHLHLFDPETGRGLAERMLAVADGRTIALPAIRDTDREVRPKAEYA